MELAVVIAISELILRYGVPAGLSIVKRWECDGEPTLDDIQSLRAMVPLPETFFKEA